MYNRWIILGIILLFGQASDSIAREQSHLVDQSTRTLMTVRYPDPPALHSFQAYKFELIHRALEITRREFGDYHSAPYQGAGGGQQRWASLLNKGDLMNVAWASPGTPTAEAEVIPIDIDIFRGLLGYRICLINSHEPLNLNEIYKTGLLTSLKVGQEETWSDVEIYRSNHMKPVLSPNFQSLFDMLGFKRFNCLPLGVNEIGLIYNEKKARYPFLAIDSQLLIYYDFPMYLYVSKTQPVLARRLQSGITKMQLSGELDQLFTQYHPLNLSSLNLRARKVVCLKSPFMDQSMQCTQSLRYPDQ